MTASNTPSIIAMRPCSTPCSLPAISMCNRPTSSSACTSTSALSTTAKTAARPSVKLLEMGYERRHHSTQAERRVRGRRGSHCLASPDESVTAIAGVGCQLFWFGADWVVHLALFADVRFDKIGTMPAAGPDRIPPGQNLLIDADDTLWENNIYFERAITDFISFLESPTLHARRSPRTCCTTSSARISGNMAMACTASPTRW